MWLIEADKALFEYLTLYCNPPWLTALSEAIGDLGTYKWPFAIFCVFYYWLNSPRFVRFLFAASLLLVCSEASAYLLKILVARPRPAVEWLIYFDPKALGFPSSHAVNTMALAFFFSRWFKKPVVWYLPLPLLMGASRVLANYHYPLDVLAGWVVGLCIGWLFWHLIQNWRWLMR